MEDDVGVDDEPVALLCVQLGMLREALGRQDRLESRKLGTQMTLLESTRNIVADVPFPKN